MIAMTLSEIASVVGGSVDGDPDVVVSGPASVDSREVPSDGLFVAVVGEHVDGHEYAADAVAAGAAAVLGSRPTGVPTVVVDDPVVALGRLAAHVVGALPDTTVIALTGSAGQDRDQGLSRPGAGHGRADGRHGRQPQQRDRGSAHRPQGHAGHPVPGAGDGRARDRPRRLSLRHRAAAGRCRAQRRHGPRGRVRQPRGDRGGQGRDPRGPARRRRRGGQRRRPAHPRDGLTNRRPGHQLRTGRRRQLDRGVVRRPRPADGDVPLRGPGRHRRPAPGRRTPAVQRCRGGRARARGGAGVRRDRGRAGRGRRPVEMADGAARERRRGRRPQRLLQRQPGVDARGGRRAGHDRGAARRPHHRRTRRDA